MGVTHKDLEFVVDSIDGGREKYFKNFEEACFAAVQKAAATGRSANLDVLVHSKAAARRWGGDNAVEMYEEDPDASVFQRLEISVNDAGRIP